MNYMSIEAHFYVNLNRNKYVSFSNHSDECNNLTGKIFLGRIAREGNTLILTFVKWIWGIGNEDPEQYIS